MTFTYPALFHRISEGGHFVKFPALPIYSRSPAKMALWRWSRQINVEAAIADGMARAAARAAAV